MNWNKIWKASMLVCMIVIAGGAAAVGIKHATTGDGTKVTDAIWAANHTIDGSVTPNATTLYDLGSSSLLWNMLYAWTLRTVQIRPYSAYEYMLFKGSDDTTRMILAGLDGATFKLYPNTTNTGSLGDSTHYWADIYATNLHSNNGGAQFIWKDADENALTLNNQNASVDWTDLDLTAFTSANAKMVYLWLDIDVDVAAKQYHFYVRKNGTTPTSSSVILVNVDEAHAGDGFSKSVIVGCDVGQIVEYKVTVEGGGQADFYIYVKGYWE